MSDWEDYYRILQVHHSAEPKVIEAAYRALARQYHPDVNKDPAAAVRMTKINLAYAILSDPKKSEEYHSEWLKKDGKTPNFAGTYDFPKPIPVVEPSFIRFNKVEPKEVLTASFVIRNIGGPYSKIFFNNPDSWVKVVRWASVNPSQGDELPLRIEIEAEGDEWDTKYSENIRVKLDEEDTQVRIELQTKPEPIKEKVSVGFSWNPLNAWPAWTPLSSIQPPHTHPWKIMAVALIILIIIWQWQGISYVWSQDTGPGPQYIGYGEPKKAQLSSKEQINVWYFSGKAGDVITIHIIPKEKNGMEAHLIDPSGKLAKKTRYTNSISFSFGDGIQFNDTTGYKLPSTGTYQVVVKILLGKKTTYEFILSLHNRT